MVTRIFNWRAWQQILFALALAGHYAAYNTVVLYSGPLWD